MRVLALCALALALAGCRNPKVAPVPLGSHLLVAQPAAARVQFLTPTSGTVVESFHTGPGPSAVTVSFDGRTALVSNAGGAGDSLTVLDLVQRSPGRSFSISPYRGPAALQFTSAGDALVAAERSDVLLEVNVNSGRVKRTLECGGSGPRGLWVHPKGKRVFVANGGSADVCEVELSSGRAGRSCELPAAPVSMTIRPDGGELWLALEDGTLAVVDTGAMALAGGPPCGGGAAAVQFTRDSRRVLVACRDSGELAVFDARSRAETARVSLAENALDPAPRPAAIQLDRRGDYAFVADPAAGRVAVVELDGPSLTGTLATGGEPRAMAFSFFDPRSGIHYRDAEADPFRR